jgi:hypothetical protein
MTDLSTRAQQAEPEEAHQCFTVSGTSYLRSLTPEDLRAGAVAIHYQKPPKKTETGMSFGLCFPILILTEYLAEKEEVAAKVAAILNEDWEPRQ